MANRVVRDKLPEHCYPRPEHCYPRDARSRVPLYTFGIAVSKRFIIDYARRHRLRLELDDDDFDDFRDEEGHIDDAALEDEKKFYGDGGRVIEIANIDDAALEDEKTFYSALSLSYTLVCKDLGKKCGFPYLEMSSPFTRDWESCVVLWTNYSWSELKGLRPDTEKIVEKLLSAMGDIEGHDTKARWWFDWDNSVVCLHTSFLCIRVDDQLLRR